MRYTIKASYAAMSLRSDHTAFASKTGTMYIWQSAQGDEIWIATDTVAGVRTIGDQWLHVGAIGGVARDGWMAIVHLGKVLCTVTDSGEVIPPTPNPDDIVKILSVEILCDMEDGSQKVFRSDTWREV